MVAVVVLAGVIRTGHSRDIIGRAQSSRSSEGSTRRTYSANLWGDLETVNRAASLPLFTQLPRRVLLGNLRGLLAPPRARQPTPRIIPLAMPSWSDVEAEIPELSALARHFLDTHLHKTLATLRRDGSPRISGTEVVFADGELWLGSMWRTVKALDLRRDPRFALHSGSADPPDWTGDAKLSGRVEEITDPERKAAVIGAYASPGSSHLFRADVTEVVVVRLGEPADHIVVESWHAGRGVTRQERR